MTQFVITKQLSITFAIEAETLEEAKTKAQKGEGTPMTHSESLNIQPRPGPPMRPGVPENVRINPPPKQK